MRIAAIGECMIELRPAGDGKFAVGFGGDTLNTAVYLARFGCAVDYITQLGDDPYSESMLADWSAEGVGVALIRQVSGRLPGLYAINNDKSGERYFTYWRGEAPARELFDNNPEELFEQLQTFDYLYLTGISLSLYRDTAQTALFQFLDTYRSKGGIVVFDVNYRPANWSGVEQAQRIIREMLSKVDIALPSFDDEKALFDFPDANACLDHYAELGVTTVVLKDGLRGCTLMQHGRRQHFPVTNVINPIDTTAAGDSFNAGFLAALLSGQDEVAGIAAGQACAGLVIQHPGAIIDRSVFIQTLSQIVPEVEPQ